MAYHLPPVQPMWSFVSPVTLPCFAPAPEASSIHLAEPIQGWRIRADGRPELRFRVRPRD